MQVTRDKSRVTTDQYVSIHIEEGVCHVTLNDPAKLNATTSSRQTAMWKVFSDLAVRDDVRVIVLTGAGKGFCSGADLSGYDDRPEGSVENREIDMSPDATRFATLPSRGWQEPYPTWPLFAVPQPVIAAVNGAAVGFGAELALQADIRVAAESARFRFPFALMGVVSDLGAGTWILPRLVGWSRAAELLYTGRFIAAQEAYEIGLVNGVAPDEGLSSTCDEMARQIAGNSPWAVRSMKQALIRGMQESSADHLKDHALRGMFADSEFNRDGYNDQFRSR